VIYTCARVPVVEPNSFILTCADAGTILQNLRWSGWGNATATATGIVHEHVCVPNCAESTSYDNYPATATVTDLAGGHYGTITVDAPTAPGVGPHFTVNS
jgi:hypothetical protein